MHDNVAFGISGNAFEAHEWGQYYNNQAYDSGTGFAGVSLDLNSKASIHDNLSHHNNYGIWLNQGTVANNRVYDNATYGIWLNQGSVTATGNKVYDNATGIYSDAYYGTNSIANNLIYDSTSRGIQLNSVQTSNGTFSVTNNTVMELNADASGCLRLQPERGPQEQHPLVRRSRTLRHQRRQRRPERLHQRL